MSQKKPIIIGEKYGKLTIIEETDIKKSGKIYVKAMCDCGNTKIIQMSHIRTGRIKTCGCYQKESVGERSKRDYQERYNKLRIIKEVERTIPKYRRVLVECDCGKVFETNLQDIKSGNTKSCGCYKLKRIRETKVTHGDSYRVNIGTTTEYTTWKAIKQRCYYKKHQFYYMYGGRGIKVCDRWLESYENFLTDMGRKPSPEYSIDRIDSDGDYTPENCRWATPKEQRGNRRTNKS